MRDQSLCAWKPVITGVPGNPAGAFASWMTFGPYRGASPNRGNCRTLREASYMWPSRASLSTQFASRTLWNMYLVARGDLAGANDA